MCALPEGKDEARGAKSRLTLSLVHGFREVRSWNIFSAYKSIMNTMDLYIYVYLIGDVFRLGPTAPTCAGSKTQLKSRFWLNFDL